MNIKDFAAKVKESYPVYQNLDDMTLTQKVIESYPVYRDQIDKGDLTALDNLKGLDNQGPIDELKGSWAPVRAGGAGIADLAAGNGLQQAASDVQKVSDSQEPDTTAAKVGSFVTDQVSPLNVAIQKGLGLAMDLSGIGPWLSNFLKDKGGDFAMAAVGKIKSLAKELNISDLDELGKFLLEPQTVGARAFDPIVTATADAQDMMETAQAIRAAAGQELEGASGLVDGAIKDAVDNEASNIGAKTLQPALDLGGLKQKVEALKEGAVGGWANLGKDVAAKFDAILKDLSAFISEQANGPTENAFSELSALKTKLGNLTNFVSQTENNKAMQMAYGAISDTLNDAASKVGDVGAKYAAANDVYHKIMAVISGLEGKAVDAHAVFTPGAMGALSATTGVLGALATHSPVATAIAAAAPYAGKVLGSSIEKYAPQVIATGLNSLPAVGPFLRAAIPPVLTAGGNLISRALNRNDEE